MANRVLKHLPEYYHVIDDFRRLDETESIELDQLRRAVDQLFDDQFVITAGLQAIKRREQMLGIQSDPAIETLDFRRRRLLNRYQTRPPFTIRYLQQQLDLVVGKGLTIVAVDPQTFMLTVTTDIENASVFREALHTINTVKPVNLIYQQQTPLQLEIDVVERISRMQMNWNYKLDGSWELGAEPFITLDTEVIVK
ncbi:putative phage tail protein [Paenibacillus yanchengensis]|uniref:Phage tail protein n=1 Tax=Paenibacillus yanchengensis TaxID=2035833 RepID=A0ABW4YNI0_9BACL